jgi:hypothetical protein
MLQELPIAVRKTRRFSASAECAYNEVWSAVASPYFDDEDDICKNQEA